MYLDTVTKGCFLILCSKRFPKQRNLKNLHHKVENYEEEENMVSTKTCQSISAFSEKWRNDEWERKQLEWRQRMRVRKDIKLNLRREKRTVSWIN